MHINKSVTHVIAWLTVIGISFFIPSPPFIVNPSLNAVLNLSILIAAFYSNYAVLMPRLYLKRSIFLYLLGAFSLLLIAFIGFSIVIDRLTDAEALANSPFFNQKNFGGRVPPFAYFPWFRSIPLTILTLIGLLFSSLLALQENNRKKELEIASVKAILLDQELGLLRSQINPHFLFNALNNIYSMVIHQSNQVGPTLLKLSEMLRYVLYDIGEKQVPVEKEINYLLNYIDLHRIKDPEQDRIKFSYNTSNRSISPMILIVFVENSFKHGKIDQYAEGYMNVDLRIDEERLHFMIENSVPPAEIPIKKNGGIGLKNVRKRLQIAYPEKHSLEIERTNRMFKIQLQITLS